MKVIGIIGAMAMEIQLIKDKIIIDREERYAGFEFFIGKYRKLDIVLTSCGIGKVNAASCTQILIDRYNVTDIINTGIAGSLNEKVKVCDIVISDNVTYYDVRQMQMKNSFPFKTFFTANKQLKKIAIKAYENSILKDYSYHIGRIITGESFVSDDNLKATIIKDYKPYCVEMEGAAIGHVADINGIPFIIIRSISDNADDNTSLSYDKFKDIASNNAALLILNMLSIINDKIKK
ncbi:5'-methylthioadenosine/adenosylhomocysteine nucleosidase [Clostridium fallax]|uniref:adenosylhomocysteine nucleosidase n=1 Tax=Clostridium fallax TaxID=1533 RepID=A0A1M4XJS8_9CLOT|nr:5'-methylthioadenosine/adenosylhomocysteine nucleosidase [Clostridium fallax]SHE93759.1 adenosylhomocysteine nucleosidase [Clostridium fallax]SQB06376.1 MTA/SAH nucleosidase [Clostridium fallax]